MLAIKTKHKLSIEHLSEPVTGMTRLFPHSQYLTTWYGIIVQPEGLSGHLLNLLVNLIIDLWDRFPCCSKAEGHVSSLFAI